MSEIQGWFSDRTGEQLYQIIRNNITTPTVVELGSWKGKSTSWFAKAIRDRGVGRVYAVDTWLGTPGEPQHQELLAGYGPDQLFQEFERNLRSLDLSEYVTAMRATTVQAARHWDGSPIGFLFIDADHKYAAVRRDFELWSPYVEDGGVIVFDDVPTWKGPSRVASELPRWFQFAGALDNVWVVQKV
jgi:predicted O-methyltransferase YrrM